MKKSTRNTDETKSLGDRNRSKNGMQGYAKFHACPETQSRKNRTTISTWKRLENSGGNGGERAWREEKEKEFNLRRRGAGCANRWNLRKCETRAEDRGCFHLMHTYTPRSQRTYRFLNFLNTFVRKNKMDKKKKIVLLTLLFNHRQLKISLDDSATILSTIYTKHHYSQRSKIPSRDHEKEMKRIHFKILDDKLHGI